MNPAWFKRIGWFYLPVFVSDTRDDVFPYFAGSFLLYDWLAERTTKL